MAAVLTLALIVFVDGMLSLLLDRDVIREPDAGPFVGVSMVVVVLAVVVTIVVRESPASILGRAVTAGSAALILSPLVGALVYSVVREELGVIPVFFGQYVLSPFVLASAVVSAVVVLAHGVLRPRR